MMWLAGLLAFLGGVLNTVQSGANATLSKTLGQPITAALVVALVNAATYLAVGLFYGLGVPDRATLAAVPAWAWFGGLLGAAYVLSSIFLAEKLGAGVFIGLTVTAGVLTSLAMDHFGLAGFKEHAISGPRALGGLLMIGGVSLVALF